MYFGIQTLVCLSIGPTPALLQFWRRLSLVYDLAEVDTGTLLQYNTIRAIEFLSLKPTSSILLIQMEKENGSLRSLIILSQR